MVQCRRVLESDCLDIRRPPMIINMHMSNTVAHSTIYLRFVISLYAATAKSWYHCVGFCTFETSLSQFCFWTFVSNGGGHYLSMMRSGRLKGTIEWASNGLSIEFGRRLASEPLRLASFHHEPWLWNSCSGIRNITQVSWRSLLVLIVDHAFFLPHDRTRLGC